MSCDMLHQRDETLAEVFAWLAVDPAFRSPAFTEQHNTRRGKGTPRMPRPLWEKVVKPLTEKVPRRMREPFAEPAKKLLMRDVDERPVIEGELREQMAAELQPEVDWLREFTGRRFATWSL
jgi:malonyl CoA-acyl carrier protein transacylase